MENNPKISIITPSFNSGEYIERAIQSVLNQDYDNWEHIVVDGGSTDGTLDILKKYDHLQWVSEPDRGQSDAMNKGFKMTTGDIIGYLNADDWYEEEVFSSVIETFSTTKECDFLVGNYYKVFVGKRILQVPELKLNHILNYKKFTFPGNPVSYFYKSELQIKVGLFPKENCYSMDYWFLLKVYQSYKIKYLDTCFGNYWCINNKSSDRARAIRSLESVKRKFLAQNITVYIKYQIWLKAVQLIGFFKRKLKN